jgi:two-component system, cell cycle response regulator DivK
MLALLALFPGRRCQGRDDASSRRIVTSAALHPGHGSHIIGYAPAAVPFEIHHRTLSIECDAMTAARRVVLIVDGHVDSRAVYRTVLEHSGYTVLEAPDGATALDLAFLVRPDAIVTEVKLPDGGSLEFLRQLKSDPRTADVCVLVVTAQAFDHVRRSAEEMGCYSFLTKPLEPGRLLASLAAAVGPAQLA